MIRSHFLYFSCCIRSLALTFCSLILGNMSIKCIFKILELKAVVFRHQTSREEYTVMEIVQTGSAVSQCSRQVMALNNWQQCLGISALNNMHDQQDLSCNQSCQKHTLLAGVLYHGGVSACRRTSTRRFELFFMVRQEEPDFEEALCYKLPQKVVQIDTRLLAYT